MNNFSHYFNMPISGHCDIDFVDIDTATDTELFLDLGLIEAGTDTFSRWCAQSVSTFFDAVFDCCRLGDKARLTELLEHSSETNDTHLGYSEERPVGRGASLNILFPIFDHLMQEGLFAADAIRNPNDIRVLAKNFDSDRMSDLLTNILRDQLYVFTATQCAKWGIPMLGTRMGWCWDPEARRWFRHTWKCPLIEGKPILLVPKWLVSRWCHCDTEDFIRHYLLPYRQKYHLDHNTPECHRRTLKNGTQKISPPTKKELRSKELSGSPLKEHAVAFARANPWTLSEFESDRVRRYLEHDLRLSDRELDCLLYVKRRGLA